MKNNRNFIETNQNIHVRFNMYNAKGKTLHTYPGGIKYIFFEEVQNSHNFQE